LIEIKSLPNYVSHWITDLVDSQERFEFTIMTKATEINSSDPEYNYFYALLVRHDQLLAAVFVFRQDLVNLTHLTKLDLDPSIIDSPAFNYFTTHNFQDRVYFMAQEIFAQRKLLGKI